MKIGTQLPKPVQTELIDFLHSNYDVITYSPTEMKSVNRDVIVHRLNIIKKNQSSEVEKEEKETFCTRKVKSDQGRDKQATRCKI